MKVIFKNAFMISLATTLFISCSNENESVSTDATQTSTVLRKLTTDYNTFENKSSIEKLSKDYENLEKIILDIQVPAIHHIKQRGVDISNTEELIVFYENCKECDNEYRDALVPLLRKLSQTEDTEVINVLVDYANNIDRLNLDETTSRNLDFIVHSMIVGANNSLLNNNGYENLPITIGDDNQYVTFGFWDCFRKTGGKAIGRGIATGMITGCVGGAIAGGTAGTVTVPVLGTAVGVVGGCIFGGAGGAVTGAIWAAVDCI